MQKPLLFIVAATIAGCAQSPSPEELQARADAEAQRDAKRAECLDAAGITGGYSSDVLITRDEVIETIKPGRGVSQAQADVANACLKDN